MLVDLPKPLMGAGDERVVIALEPAVTPALLLLLSPTMEANDVNEAPLPVAKAFSRESVWAMRSIRARGLEEPLPPRLRVGLLILGVPCLEEGLGLLGLFPPPLETNVPILGLCSGP